MRKGCRYCLKANTCRTVPPDIHKHSCWTKRPAEEVTKNPNYPRKRTSGILTINGVRHRVTVLIKKFKKED